MISEIRYGFPIFFCGLSFTYPYLQQDWPRSGPPSLRLSPAQNWGKPPPPPLTQCRISFSFPQKGEIPHFSPLSLLRFTKLLCALDSQTTSFLCRAVRSLSFFPLLQALFSPRKEFALSFLFSLRLARFGRIPGKT